MHFVQFRMSGDVDVEAMQGGEVDKVLGESAAHVTNPDFCFLIGAVFTHFYY